MICSAPIRGIPAATQRCLFSTNTWNASWPESLPRLGSRALQRTCEPAMPAGLDHESLLAYVSARPRSHRPG